MFAINFSMPDGDGTKIGSPWLASFTYVQASEQPDWSFFMHTHDHALELSYVLGGRGALYCGGKYYELLPGTVVIKNPGIQHAENSDPQNPIEQICLLVDGLETGFVPPNHLPIGTLPPVIEMKDRKNLLKAISEDMLACIVKKEQPDRDYANRLLSFMLYIILDELQNHSKQNLMDEHGKLMEEVRFWLDNHYSENLSLDAIADHFHISVYYLSRQFRKHTGLTVNNYLVSCRIGDAQRRLVFNNERIDTIALKCGFSNLSYFYATFRKKVGCTPVEYKQIYKRSV